MSNFYNELKKSPTNDNYLQKNYIPITIKRKYRKKNNRGTYWAEISGIFSEYSKARKKVARKKSPRLMLRLHYVFALRLICVTAVCISILFTHYMSVFAGAISVPREARNTAENAKMAAQSVIDAEQAVLYRLNAEEYVEDAAMLAEDIEEKVKQAEKLAEQKRREAEGLRAKAQIAAQAAKAARDKFSRDKAAAEKAVAEANNADNYAKNLDDGAKIRIEDISRETAKKLEELDTQEEDISEKKLRELANKALTEITKLQEETSGAINAAYDRATRLSEIADSLEAKADESELIADKKNDEADLAEDMAKEAEDEALSLQEIYEDLVVDLYDARADERTTKINLENLIREQAEPPPGVRFSGGSINYYSWSDSHGNNGHQIAKPFYYGYWQKDYSYGISASHVNSSNNSAGESGNVSTFTDVTVSVDKRKENEKYIYNYGVDVNLPTGKPTLSWFERYAMMTEDLVEVSQFGKGWGITPRFAVSKKINKEDTLTFGTSYSFNGSYDPTSDIPNDTLSPGNEWKKNLRWQHAGQKWQFVGELIHTSSGPTKISNGNSYPVASSWEQRLTYNRKLNEAEDLMFYFWRESAAPDAVLPGTAQNSATNYLGTMWSKKLNEKRTFRLTFDVMKSSGNHYSGMTNGFDENNRPQYTSVSVDGRTKYTVGAIYEYKLNQDSKITAELQKFTMKDGQSSTGKPPTNYNGVNFFVSFSKNF